MTASPYSAARNDSLHTGEVVGSIPTAPTTQAIDNTQEFLTVAKLAAAEKYETERKHTHPTRGPSADDVRSAFFPFTLILLSTLLLIIAARTARHYAAPAHHECVKPTGIPATWFGDCGAMRFGVGR